MPHSDNVLIPNLYIVGSPKSGTSSLAEELGRSTDVSLARSVETRAFLSDDPLSALDGEFRIDARWRLDATPNYLSNAAMVLPKLRQTMGSHALNSAWFLCILRHPIDRLVSHVKHNIVRGSERRSLEATLGALAEFGDRPGESYLLESGYSSSLRVWADSGFSERIRLSSAENLYRNRVSSLSELGELLECSDLPNGEALRLNTGGVAKSPLLARAMASQGYLKRVGSRALPPHMRRRIQTHVHRFNTVAGGQDSTSTDLRSALELALEESIAIWRMTDEAQGWQTLTRDGLPRNT